MVALWLLALSTLVLAAVLAAAFFFLQTQQGLRNPLTTQPALLVLTGPQASGKTALFSKLAHAHTEVKPTYTSQSANSAPYHLPGSHRAVQLVDVPGHPKLRGLAHLTSSQSDLRGARWHQVVFVLDAATVARQAASVAQALLMTLTQARAQGLEGDKMLVLANKTDLFTALDEQGVRRVLEEAIEAIQVGMTGAVRMETMAEGEGNGAGGEQALDWLAERGEKVTLAGEGIEVVCGSVLKGDGMEALLDWLD